MKAEGIENKNSLLAICRSSEAAGGARSNCYEFFCSFCRYKKNEEKLLSPAANDNPELSQHYFNANHLGSGSLITDDVGATYQTLAYAPHGELLVNEINGTYDEPYKFTGYERDQESGLDYMGARYRNVEAVIPLSTDRFWFKTPHLSPYNFAANNPMRYVDVNGDSVGVTSNITNNAALNESFNLFASSKEGIKFLSDYAAKGQTIVGHTYTKDGKYHKKDVNLYYTAEDLGVDGEGGNTTNGDNGLSYVVTINSNPITFLNGRQYSVNGKYPDSYLLSQVIALFHESFIHVDLFVRDLMSNGVGRDYDCFPDYIRSLSKTTLYRKEAHHAFVKYYDNASPLFPAAALRGVIEVNSRLGNIYSKSLLEKMIWYYHGGKY